MQLQNDIAIRPNLAPWKIFMLEGKRYYEGLAPSIEFGEVAIDKFF
jgi:hypothetical protein